MQTNAARVAVPITTHGGSTAARITPIQQLRRSVLSCLLWEREFYEAGTTIAARIKALVPMCAARDVAALAIEARQVQHLRHVPLFLMRELARLSPPGGLVASTLPAVIQRADELAEFMALYWADGKRPLSKQVRRGLATAFLKFDAYQIGKYNREKAVTLRDVMFMVHPKPTSDAQAALFRQLADGTVPVPDTWETELSAGKDKRATFIRLITEGKLGYSALLRNLRGMAEAGVPVELVQRAILERRGGADKVLPFRFIAAARAAPQFEPQLDVAMMAGVEGMPKLPGRTLVMVDVSGSMDRVLSAKSDLTRADAAAALASIIPCEALRVMTFSDMVVECPPRRGMAGVDVIRNSQRHSGTALAHAVNGINQKVDYDRLIVITDEQATDSGRCKPHPNAKGYMINVASAKNGIGYGAWTHIDGFSEGVLRWIHEYERELEGARW